ncbi:MAG TPA: hypothetical protein VI653_05240 [Steroidobacteraceae bacterium]
MSTWLPGGRAQWTAMLGSVMVLGFLLVSFAPAQERLLSYLFAFLFFTGLSIGSLALLMVHALTGGAWGDLLRQPLLAAARTLPLQALLAIPILLNLPDLYSWANPNVTAHDPLLREQSWYLAPILFVARTIVYFVLWITFMVLIGAAARDPRRTLALPRIASCGLIVYALTSLFAATDWAMSLLPHWHSSTFGMMVATGWMLAAAALAILCTVAWSLARIATADLLHDLGNLLLMFVLGWSYLAFMQYLTVWIADLPAETAWYIPRTLSSWRGLAIFLIAFHFAVPFAVLLSRRAKRRALWLAGIAALLLIAHMADAFWLVVPTFRPRGFAIRASDLLASLGMGGLWCSIYLGQLRTTAWAATASIQPTPHPMESAHG